MDQFRDFKEILPNLILKTIFDVGANRGQSSTAFRKACPDADIYAFEPVETTYALLCKELEADKKTECFRTAFGDVQGVAKMSAVPGSVRNKIGEGNRGVDVEVDTGDHFCASRGIEGINFLKIDAEGYDLKVCKGFGHMLKTQAIDLIQVEAGLNPLSQRHVPLQAFRDYLEPLGYGIFRIYDQAGNPLVSRCNVVFASRTAAQLNPKTRKISKTPKARGQEPLFSL